MRVKELVRDQGESWDERVRGRKVQNSHPRMISDQNKIK